MGAGLSPRHVAPRPASVCPPDQWAWSGRRLSPSEPCSVLTGHRRSPSRGHRALPGCKSHWRLTWAQLCGRLTWPRPGRSSALAPPLDQSARGRRYGFPWSPGRPGSGEVSAGTGRGRDRWLRLVGGDGGGEWEPRSSSRFAPEAPDSGSSPLVQHPRLGAGTLLAHPFSHFRGV